jgi:hypothetical protein
LNPIGSYKKFLGNSKQALFAAVEIYNKPKFDYREEVSVILLVNAWELLLLAILAKHKKRTLQKKERNKDYKTLQFDDAFQQTKSFFPRKIKQHSVAVEKNLSSIRKYRNKFIHYYHDKQAQHVMYGLIQSAIMNYVDLTREIFSQDITKEVNTVLLPLSFNNQPEFIEFFRSTKPEEQSLFSRELFVNLKILEGEDIDTTRFYTQCAVKFTRANNIKASDFEVSDNTAPVVFQKINPDDTYPFLQKDIIGIKKGSKKHKKLNKELSSYEFQAILKKHDIKNNEKYCWCSRKAGSPRYSQGMIDFLNRLSADEINQAIQKYKNSSKKK